MPEARGLPACPACGGTLRVEMRMEVVPPGTYSLAGQQRKVATREHPWVVCEGCGVEARTRPWLATDEDD